MTLSFRGFAALALSFRGFAALALSFCGFAALTLSFRGFAALALFRGFALTLIVFCRFLVTGSAPPVCLHILKNFDFFRNFNFCEKKLVDPGHDRSFRQNTF